MLGAGVLWCAIYLVGILFTDQSSSAEGPRPESESQEETAASVVEDSRGLDLAKLEYRNAPLSKADFFSTRPLVKPQQAEAAAVVQSAPAAPSLPFVYVGRFGEPGEEVLFLRWGERAIRAKVGERLDETYLVSRVDSSQVVFTYLPMNVEQVLSLPGAR
jgi:hypothetical protein